MTSPLPTPPEPVGGIALTGSVAPPPPPPPPPPPQDEAYTDTYQTDYGPVSSSASMAATAPATATPTASLTATGGPPPAGQISASLPTTATPTASLSATGGPQGGIPAYSHVVMVILENHGYTQIVGSANAPYINSLISQGAALFTDSHGGPDVLHPSFPNYMQLFSGNTQGVVNDACPPPGQPYSTANLFSAVVAAGKTVGGYAESAPAGHTACGPSPYAGRHVPWVWWSNVATSAHHDFSAFPTTSAGYAALPNMSIVVPDLSHDMHSFGTFTDAQVIRNGDTWIKTNLDGYAQWAKTNNSLYVIQLDEDNFTTSDRIPTLFTGQHVKAGTYSEHITHYNLLRTLCDVFGAAHPGKTGTLASITDCWN